MFRNGLLTSIFVLASTSLLASQTPPRETPPQSAGPRIHITQDELCCLTTYFVEPTYPREARLAHIEGVVKLILVIAADGSIADLRAISGDSLLRDSTLNAVRQWRFLMGHVEGDPREAEVPLTFTFRIEDPPKPAYLHLVNGEVIRADEVHEFTYGIVYSAERRTHHISASSITGIDGCARVTVKPTKAGDCIPAGGPSFTVRAIPLLPAAGSRGSRSKTQSH